MRTRGRGPCRSGLPALHSLAQRCVARPHPLISIRCVGLFTPQLEGRSSTTWFGMLKAEVIKVFSELRCVMLWLSEMGEVQEGLESAFAAAEVASGVAQPAPRALRR